MEEKLTEVVSIINDYVKSNHIEEDEFNYEVCRNLLDHSKSLKKLLVQLFNSKNSIYLLDQMDLDIYSNTLIDYYINDCYLDDSNLETLCLLKRDINKYPLLSLEEEKILFQKLSNGDDSVRHSIIHHNLRLVFSMAKKYSNGDNDLFLDYFQEGNIGLMQATYQFDVTKGYKFSTYATKWIKKYILLYHDNCLDEIKKTQQVKKNKSTIDQAEIFLENYYGRKPTPLEISKFTHLPVETIKRTNLCYRPKVYLNEKLNDSDSEYINYLESRERSVEEQAIDELFKGEIYSYLTDDEIKLIKYRYGLDDQKTYTLKEIGKFYGVTRKAINLREKKVLEKLRKKLK